MLEPSFVLPRFLGRTCTKLDQCFAGKKRNNRANVNEAKRQVFGLVGIDQLAGPSEIFVVADETGDSEMIAADLLAQAEHDVRTRVGLITTDATLAERTAETVVTHREYLNASRHVFSGKLSQ